mgnify:FL=1
MLIPKWIARKPLVRTRQYLKFGFVVTEHECHDCPRCGYTLNAGPNYQPRYCDRCGQKIDFSGTEWTEERQLDYAERGNAYEPVKN